MSMVSDAMIEKVAAILDTSIDAVLAGAWSPCQELPDKSMVRSGLVGTLKSLVSFIVARSHFRSL